MNDGVNKEILTREEKFAKEIIELAESKGLTVADLREATYIAQKIANESNVSSMGIDRYFS